ncbi:UNVERIFIED_CONTAM: hypothetical protein RMT77_017939 [Armadillidium vulgare]
MKGICFLLAIIACVSAISTVRQEWEAFKVKYNKTYTPEEDARHHKIFMENKLKISEHNKKFKSGEVSFTVSINQFADMLPEELSYLRGYKQRQAKERSGPYFEPPVGVEYPTTVDWRTKGYVTPVKDQGQCGSCWAFASTGGLEGQNFAKRGKLVSLSEQNLVDCVPGSSCSGGWMNDAFEYVRRNGGIDTEASYPYTARNGNCKYSPYYVGGTCSGYKNVRNTESDLLAATATVGPISVAIDASNWSFQTYSSGVYYEPSCSSYYLDHAVLVVGYGTYNSKPYWLVKNSWGTSWGERGYIKMSRNRNNNCGIANEASFPLV